MAINTTSSMSGNLQIYYQKRLLDRLTKKLVMEPLGVDSLNIPKGAGATANWLRYAERHVTTTSSFLLGEGVVPTDSSITTGTLTATVLQYGNYAIVSDLLDWTARDPVKNSISDVLADEAAELVDTLIISNLDSNLPIQYCNGKGSLATTGVSDVMTVKEALKARVTLRKNYVPEHESGSYVCVIAPTAEGDILNDTNAGSFLDIHKYTDAAPAMNGEIGKAFGVRFMMSQNISSTATGTLAGATVYSNKFLGQGCFGVVRLGTDNVEMKMKSAGGSENTADPLDQINTIGYKLKGFVVKYLGGSGNQTSDRGLSIKGGSAY